MTNAVEWSVIVLGLTAMTGIVALCVIAVMLIRRGPQNDGRLASQLVANLVDTYHQGVSTGRNESSSQAPLSTSGLSAAMDPADGIPIERTPEERDEPVEVDSR